MTNPTNNTALIEALERVENASNYGVNDPAEALLECGNIAAAAIRQALADASGGAVPATSPQHTLPDLMKLYINDLERGDTDAAQGWLEVIQASFEPAQPIGGDVRERVVEIIREYALNAQSDDFGEEDPEGIADAILATLSATPQSGWRPMSEAPKDGTHIDLLMYRIKRPHPEWVRYASAWWQSGEWYNWFGSTCKPCNFFDEAPQFWMPISPPPQPPEQRGE